MKELVYAASTHDSRYQMNVFRSAGVYEIYYTKNKKISGHIKPVSTKSIKQRIKEMIDISRQDNIDYEVVIDTLGVQ